LFGVGIFVIVWSGYLCHCLVWVSLSLFGVGIFVIVWSGYLCHCLVWVSLSLFGLGIFVIVWCIEFYFPNAGLLTREQTNSVIIVFEIVL
jgi:hypothetical protein